MASNHSSELGIPNFFGGGGSAKDIVHIVFSFLEILLMYVLVTKFQFDLGKAHP